MSKPYKMWAVYPPEKDYPTIVTHTHTEAIKELARCWTDQNYDGNSSWWRKHKAKGWRCVRVIVVPNETVPEIELFREIRERLQDVQQEVGLLVDSLEMSDE